MKITFSASSVMFNFTMKVRKSLDLFTESRFLNMMVQIKSVFRFPYYGILIGGPAPVV